MRVDDLTSIVRLAGIKRTVTEAGEQDGSERQAAIAKLKKMTSGNEYNDANHTYIDPKTGAIIYSRDGSSMPARSFTDPKYTGSVGSELRNLLKQAGLSVTADAQGNARVDPVAFANLGREPVAPPQSTAGPSGETAPANNPGVTTSAVPSVRITTPGPTGAGEAGTQGATGSSGAAPTPAPTVPPGINPENGLQQYTPVNYTKDTLREPPGTAKKKVLAPVDPQLKTLQQGLLDTDSKYKELLGPFGADGRIGKYTRNALKQYIEDNPDEAKSPKLIPFLTKYGIIPAAPTSGPAAPTSGPQGPAAPTSGPAAPTASTRPAGDVRKSIEAIASKYKVSESRLTPVGQIQKFRQLIDEADAEVPPKPKLLPGESYADGIKRLRGEELKRLADKLKTDWNSADQDRYHRLEAEQQRAIAAEKKAKATTPANPEPAKATTPTNTAEPDPQGRKEPKLGNPTVQPPKAGTPVPGTPGYEFTGEVDAKGRPKARKIIVPPAAIEAEVVAAQQAGKLGLKQALPRVLGMLRGLATVAFGWKTQVALGAMAAISWMYDLAYENGTRVNISREDMVQLGKDKQALEVLASNKNLTPEEQKEVAAAMEQMARILANSETIDDVWAKVGIPGRSGAPKNK